MSKPVTRKILIPKATGSIKRSEIRAAIKHVKAQPQCASKGPTRKTAKNAFHLRPAS